MKQLLVAFTLSIISCASLAQDSTEIVNDTVEVHSVKKAVIFSAAIPGAGQIYNHIAMPKGQKKAFWKLPLIYGSLGASTFFLIRNQIEQKRYRCEYSNRQYLSYEIPAEFSPYDDEGILTIYNQYLNWRDLSILAVGAFYFLQIVDAGVEAHFVSFDVSEDLSLSLHPTVMNGFAPGVSLRLNFR
jgi:hypothetical protein